jgi:hypothetical protein
VASSVAGAGAAVKAVAALAVLVAAGSAAGFVLGIGPFADASTDPIDQTPAEADVVFYTDMEIRDDPATKELVNASLSTRADEPYYGGPTSHEELLNETSRNTGLDPSNVEQVLGFGAYPPEGSAPDRTQYWGVILHAGWTADEITTELENQTDGRTWTQTSYNGHTVYESEPQSEFQDRVWFGVLDDGQFVMGTPEAVKETIDVTEGDQQPVDGDLRSQYDRLRDDALVAFAADVPRDRIPEETVDRAAEQAPIDYTAFTSVDVVSGAYYTSSGTVGVTVNMQATDADAAKDVHDVTDGGISFASGTVSNETVKEGLRDVEVARDGSTVTVSYEKSVDRLTQLLAALEELGV